jgi:hypothetical protein
MATDPLIQPEIAHERRQDPVRELAQRLSGTSEVLLLWYPDSNRVELSVRELATGDGFQVEVAPGSANDAFHHPYAYVARHENIDLVPVVATSEVDPWGAALPDRGER